MAPTKPSTGWPSLNITQNGMLRTPNISDSCDEICGTLSASSLASVKRPAYSTSSFSSTGPSCLQGPHHSAQMSSSTGVATEPSISSAWKFSRVMSIIGTNWG
jgi:hypothetical protein